MQKENDLTQDLLKDGPGYLNVLMCLRTDYGSFWFKM